MKILIASDHAGLELKTHIKNLLAQKQISVEDLGPQNTDSVDYPDFAQRLCEKMPKVSSSQQPEILGILVCGSGQGMAMKANKYSYIRAALCWDLISTQLAREHNNANILCLGGRLLPNGLALEMVERFLTTQFLGGRHEKRVLKISQ